MSRTALSRVGTLLAVAIVAFTTFAITLHAAQTITTPNETFFTYNLAAGASSAAITPIANAPVLVQGVQTTLGYRGVGHVSLLRVPSSFLEWTGIGRRLLRPSPLVSAEPKARTSCTWTTATWWISRLIPPTRS